MQAFDVVLCIYHREVDLGNGDVPEELGEAFAARMVRLRAVDLLEEPAIIHVPREAVDLHAREGRFRPVGLD